MTNPVDHTNLDGPDKRIARPSPATTILYGAKETPQQDTALPPLAPLAVLGMVEAK
jgi:hypothetical protein